MGSLRQYVLRRLATLLFVVLALLTIMFALFKLLPGDPTAIFVFNGFSQEMVDRTRHLWGLDAPLYVQYWRYMVNMLTFHFGVSFFQNTPVSGIVAQKLLNTCAMMLPALFLSIILGALIGAFAGWKRGTKFESGTIATLLFMHSTPSFFVGIMVLMVFSYMLRWFPPGGMVSPGSGGTFWQMVLSLDFLKHLILPTLVVFSREVTGPALLLRSSMLEVKGSDFLDVLRAKGLPPNRIVAHATRNALLPLVTYVAVTTGFIFQGQVVLEIIFAWPGVGRELIMALNDLDYPIAQAAFYLMALTILTLNFIADVLYGLVDPRITYH